MLARAFHRADMGFPAVSPDADCFRDLKMLYNQLHSLRSAVFVDVQPECKLHALLGPDLHSVVVIEMPERNGLAVDPGSWLAKAQLQMPIIQNPGSDDDEGAIEYGFRKTLSPRATVAEHSRSLDRQFAR